MVNKEDISTLTQLVTLIEDRGCSVDKATAQEHSKMLGKISTTMEVELAHIKDCLTELLKRSDADRADRESLRADVNNLKRDRHWLAVIAGAVGALITAALSGAFILFHK